MKFILSIILIFISVVGILGGALIFNHGSAAGFHDVKEHFELIGSAIILENVLLLIFGLIVRKKLSK
jgi:hypothetical protein